MAYLRGYYEPQDELQEKRLKLKDQMGTREGGVNRSR
jgi:hypothetical protein